MSNQQLARQEQIKTTLFQQAGKQITALLNGDKERANKFMAASMVVASDYTLRNCSPESIVQSLVGVAMLDLSVDKTIGHCYLVPYKDSVQLQIGYKGMIQLLFRAGWMVKVFPVYRCDEFSMDNNGWDNNVKFIPNIDERDDGDKEWVVENLRGVYVVARNSETKDEYSTFVGKNVIEKLRLNSPNQRATQYSKPADKARLDAGLPIGIWADWYVEMSCAKAVKKLAKLLPIGDSRATLALVVDDKADMGQRIDYSRTAENGVVIDVEEMEAKPAKKKAGNSVDSLIGGQKSDSIKPQPAKDVEPASTVEAEYSDMPDFPPIESVLQPEPLGTMPIPELEPAKEPRNGLFISPEHKKWMDEIDAWQTLTDIANTTRDMPAKIKADLKEYMAEKNAQVKRKIDISNWVKEISNCNSREEFTALQKRMPESIRNDEVIQYNLRVREDYGINNHPELW